MPIDPYVVANEFAQPILDERMMSKLRRDASARLSMDPKTKHLSMNQSAIDQTAQRLFDLEKKIR